MNIAIYSRKSRFTGKGESVENQVEMCTEYIKSHFGQDYSVSVYEDEGFTGANTDRPQFQQCIHDIKHKKFDILICYRLDRISRSVADFSSTLEILENSHCAFISIKEQFDTSTPMGRAMLYIASVFAQLERETIAERVRDNMLQLSKTGRWLGGKTPLGFASKEISTTDPDGRIHKQYQLIPVPEEIVTVKYIYKKFLELGSLIKLQSYLTKNDFKTSRGNDYHLSSLRFILTNPVYACADETLYDYLTAENFNVCSPQSLFDGCRSVMGYNRTRQKNNKTCEKRSPQEWIIAVSDHPPAVSSNDWIKVQTLMALNRQKTFRKVHNSQALLAGLLKCQCCGSYMRPKRSRMSADGSTYHFYYICELKERSNGTKCNVKNLAGHLADAAIIKQLSQFPVSDACLLQKIKSDGIKVSAAQSDLSSRMEGLKKEIHIHEAKINNLLYALELSKDSLASKYIAEQINVLAQTVKHLKEKLSLSEAVKQSCSASDNRLDLMVYTLQHFNELYEKASITERRRLIRHIISSLSWDGKKIYARLFPFQSHSF